MSTPKTFYQLAQEWREARESKKIFLSAETYAVMEACAGQLEALIREWDEILKLPMTISGSNVFTIGDMFDAILGKPGGAEKP